MKGGLRVKVFTRKELCQKLGVNIGTLEYWKRQGLKPKKGGEGLLVYTDKEVYDFLIKFKLSGSYYERFLRYRPFINEYENESK